VHHNDTKLISPWYDPAHTDSDIAVLFEDPEVVHVGDTWWNGVYPFIDYSTGGSIDRMIRATRRNLEDVTDKTIIISAVGRWEAEPISQSIATCWSVFEAMSRDSSTMINSDEATTLRVAARPAPCGPSFVV
jgi:glyoxylase-like metal-dependent hydrolase (beta-lactamase superfamily II)